MRQSRGSGLAGAVFRARDGGGEVEVSVVFSFPFPVVNTKRNPCVFSRIGIKLTDHLLFLFLVFLGN